MRSKVKKNLQVLANETLDLMMYRESLRKRVDNETQHQICFVRVRDVA